MNTMDTMDKNKRLAEKNEDSLFLSEFPEIKKNDFSLKAILKKEQQNIDSELLNLKKQSGKSHFKPEGYFAFSSVEQFIDIINYKNKFLFASDRNGNKIYRLDLEGNHEEVIHNKLSSPNGLFLDSNDNLWICNSGSNSLVCIDITGKEIKKIELSKIFNFKESYYPSFGCCLNNSIYLIIINKSYGKRKIVYFEKDNPEQTLKEINSPDLYLPSYICSQKKNIYISDFETGKLLKYSESKNKVTPFQTDPVQNLNKFLITDNSIFFSSGDYLTASNLVKGEMESITFLPEILGKNSINILGMETGISNGEQFLFLSDFYSGRIYRLKVLL